MLIKSNLPEVLDHTDEICVCDNLLSMPAAIIPSLVQTIDVILRGSVKDADVVPALNCYVHYLLFDRFIHSDPLFEIEIFMETWN